MMLADGNGEFLGKLGLVQDLTKVGFGPVRSLRYVHSAPLGSCICAKPLYSLSLQVVLVK